ncbi:hypothetical protein GRF29_112g396156, partial [Pseudopithomyces chartarum]
WPPPQPPTQISPPPTSKRSPPSSATSPGRSATRYSTSRSYSTRTRVRLTPRIPTDRGPPTAPAKTPSTPSSPPSPLRLRLPLPRPPLHPNVLARIRPQPP